MIIGVTGNFGAGKTTVTNMFRCLGARVIDADEIAHSIIKPYSRAYKKIVDCFGRDVLSGIAINRKRLARIAFSDKRKLKKLNEITHPEILKIIKSRIKKTPGKETLIIDAALLIESGLVACIDKLVVVKLDPAIQMQRLKKAGSGCRDIKQRLNSQYAQSRKIRLADFIIDNSGTRKQTERQVRDIWKKISKERDYRER